jgi:hypothetical protein
MLMFEVAQTLGAKPLVGKLNVRRVVLDFSCLGFICILDRLYRFREFDTRSRSAITAIETQQREQLPGAVAW